MALPSRPQERGPPVSGDTCGSSKLRQPLESTTSELCDSDCIGVMITALFAMLAYLRAFLIARHRLAIEAVALRQQLAVYKRKQPRPKLNRFDRLFWVIVRRVWVIKTPAALDSRASESCESD